MNHAVQTIICLIISAVLLSSCEDDRLKIDVSTIGVDTRLERADLLWKDMSPIGFRESHPRYLTQYKDVYTHYIQDVLRLGNVNDSNLYASIREFTKHPDFEQVYKEVELIFPESDDFESELDDAWKHYSYYFPEAAVPYQFACVCGFNNPLIMTESGIGLCMEMYLGDKCRFYNYLQLPVYLRHRMTPKHLVPWMMKAWLETEFVQENKSPSLLEDIVQAGKIFFCMDAIFPLVEDSIKIGYTSTEMTWARDHERFVWAHFVDNELLFETNIGVVGKFTNDGPFTVDLVKESPSRMGYFIGWQMVREYMSRQESVDLPKLMATDAQEILNKSKYKP
ncbi:MAG: hypothetical protein R2813_05615 [Flavobacteriales bacterium]